MQVTPLFPHFPNVFQKLLVELNCFAILLLFKSPFIKLDSYVHEEIMIQYTWLSPYCLSHIMLMKLCLGILRLLGTESANAVLELILYQAEMAFQGTMGWLVMPNLKTKVGSGNKNLHDFSVLNAFKCTKLNYCSGLSFKMKGFNTSLCANNTASGLNLRLQIINSPKVANCCLN